MFAAKPAVAEIKARGQLTIPKKIRDAGNLDEGQAVAIIPVGDSIIVTPKRLELEEARRQIKKILKQSGLAADDLIAGLKEDREAVFQKIYGKKRGR
ncbi:MAG: AbrB/MazE/SpoVT family DNA-binding domain-containing protein [Nitrospinae bacterium]|nr:AbrB/MazE/SpoVT family DNA-binding domain-containing protein [Nitrospinota bacterium]